MSKKNPLTPAGIESATFRFVAQRLKHCATAVPNFSSCSYINYIFMLIFCDVDTLRGFSLSYLLTRLFPDLQDI